MSAVAPVAIGDDVLVTFRPANGCRELGIVGELLRRAADAVELRQFNPAKSIRIDVADVESIAKIVGESF